MNSVPTYISNPAYREITPTEMLRLRGEGMSNKQIAEATGVSSVTVRKYIGKQGFRVGPDASAKQSQTEPIAPEIRETPKPACLLTRTMVRLAGSVATYEIECQNGMITATGDTVQFVLDRESAEHLVREMIEAIGLMRERREPV